MAPFTKPVKKHIGGSKRTFETSMWRSQVGNWREESEFGWKIQYTSFELIGGSYSPRIGWDHMGKNEESEEGPGSNHDEFHINK